MPTGTWFGDWATGDVVTAAEFRKSLGCVSDTTLGVAAASFDLTSLPTTYAHLRLELYLRTDDAAISSNIGIRFNNDTAANYDRQMIYGQAAASTISEVFAATSVSGIIGVANTAPANVFTTAVIDIANYGGSTNNKSFTGSWASKVGTTTTTLQAGLIAGFWRSSAAINRVTLIDVTGGNFAAGSRCSVYVMGS